MRIQMLKTISGLETTFHAGQFYNAEPAFNRPNHIRDGLFYVQRQGKKLTDDPKVMLVSRAAGELKVV